MCASLIFDVCVYVCVYVDEDEHNVLSYFRIYRLVSLITTQSSHDKIQDVDPLKV